MWAILDCGVPKPQRIRDHQHVVQHADVPMYVCPWAGVSERTYGEEEKDENGHAGCGEMKSN